MTTIKTECGAELDEHTAEWVINGCYSVHSLDWLLDDAVGDNECLTAHRVRQLAPSDIDPGLYAEALWEGLGEMIYEDERYAHDDGAAELAAWADVPQHERDLLVSVLRNLIYNNVDTSNAAWQPTGETVTVHPDERVVLTREEPW